MMTCGWKSRPTNAVAGRSGPSLAILAATSGSKRRQGSCGVRKDSPERLNVVEAETVPVVEGQVYAIVNARWRRSTGVADRITHERSSSGPGRPDRVRRHRRRRGLVTREDRSGESSRGRESDLLIVLMRRRRRGAWREGAGLRTDSVSVRRTGRRAGSSCRHRSRESTRQPAETRGLDSRRYCTT